MTSITYSIAPIDISLSVTQCYLTEGANSQSFFVIDYSSMTLIKTVSEVDRYIEKIICASWSTESTINFFFYGSVATKNYAYKYDHNSETIISMPFQKTTYGTFIDSSEISTVKYLTFLSDNKKLYILDNDLNVQWEQDVSTEFPDANTII